jgi:hypothetical protein
MEFLEPFERAAVIATTFNQHEILEEVLEKLGLRFQKLIK